MIQNLSILALTMLSTFAVAAQKPNTKHCYKLKTEEDLFDGTKTTRMGGLKYNMSMVTYTEIVAEGDTTFLVGGSLLKQGFDTQEGMTFLFDDGEKIELPGASHRASAGQYGWTHVGVGAISRKELEQFATVGVRAIRIGLYDSPEITGNSAKSIFMTGAYCLLNRDNQK
ncbi:hypothetical protein N9L83_02910 [Flavobacteriales bacterium]|nr:hypothetical protein [Flavobacteriales bacterium]